MNKVLGLILLTLIGCTDKLSHTPSRDNQYDAIPPAHEVRVEPYAVLEGYCSEGRLFLIHWTGNKLDKTGMLEKDVDEIGFKKYLE